MKTRLQESELWWGRCKWYKTQRRENSLPGKHQWCNTFLLLCYRWTTREPPLELYLTLKHSKPTHAPSWKPPNTQSCPPTAQRLKKHLHQNVPKATAAANAAERSECAWSTADEPPPSRPFPLDSIVRKKFMRISAALKAAVVPEKKIPNAQYHSHKKRDWACSYISMYII